VKADTDDMEEEDDSHLLSDAERKHYLSEYVTHHDCITEEERTANSAYLSILISTLRIEIEQIELESRKPIHVENEERCHYRYVHQIAQLKCWFSQTLADICELQASRLSKLIVIARCIRDVIIRTPGTVSLVNELNAKIRREMESDPLLAVLRDRQTRLIARIHRTIASHIERDFGTLLRQDVLDACAHFQAETCYSPESAFDRALAEYILRNQGLAAWVGPVVRLIAATDMEELEQKISDFSLSLMDSLKVTAGPARAVIFTALVRFVFGIAYTVNPAPLQGNYDDNCEFLAACDRFSWRPLRDLIPADWIARNYTAGLPLRALFKSKQVNMLKMMEFMTNPIDLMQYVLTIMGNLAQHFGGGGQDQVLASDDMLALLFALLSISPPGNAIAIADFLVRWQPLQLSNLSLPADYFVIAVQEISRFGKAHPERGQQSR
jgi:hypothetical protein